MILRADGEKFFKPAGGWQDKLFVVITQHSHVNTSMTSSQQPSLSLTAIKNEPATTPVPVTSSSVDNGGGGGLSAKKSHVKSTFVNAFLRYFFLRKFLWFGVLKGFDDERFFFLTLLKFLLNFRVGNKYFSILCIENFQSLFEGCVS